MSSSVKSLQPSEEIIRDQLYNAYDPRFLLSYVSDAQNALLSPLEDQSKMLVNLKSSLIGFTLEQLP